MTRAHWSWDEEIRLKFWYKGKGGIIVNSTACLAWYPKRMFQSQEASKATAKKRPAPCQMLKKGSVCFAAVPEMQHLDKRSLTVRPFRVGRRYLTRRCVGTGWGETLYKILTRSLPSRLWEVWKCLWHSVRWKDPMTWVLITQSSNIKSMRF